MDTFVSKHGLKELFTEQIETAHSCTVYEVSVLNV